MNKLQTNSNQAIKKLHIKSASIYAINNIPDVDENTLHRFLELINVTGNFGTISTPELLDKMRLICKHIPGSCSYSLYVLAELLEIKTQAPTTPLAMISPSNEAVFLTQLSKAKVVTTAQR